MRGQSSFPNNIAAGPFDGITELSEDLDDLLLRSQAVLQGFWVRCCPGSDSEKWFQESLGCKTLKYKALVMKLHYFHHGIGMDKTLRSKVARTQMSPL